jgi:peroxiredoxin
MESSNLNFQSQLKNINFKTRFCSQMVTSDYNDLFANRRVVVFSISRMFTPESYHQIKIFNEAYSKILEHGIDNVYSINSFERIYPAWSEYQSENIIGLSDIDCNFVKPLAEIYQPNDNLSELSKYWQYIVILNNGTIEKIWKVPFKSGVSLRIRKHHKFQYLTLRPETVLDYLQNSVDNSD